jgi:FXSXX-COOH protein
MDVKPAPGDPGFVPVIDVSHLSLAELTRADHPAMARSLRQVINTLDDPNGVISAFQSFASSGR